MNNELRDVLIRLDRIEKDIRGIVKELEDQNKLNKAKSEYELRILKMLLGEEEEEKDGNN